MKFFVFPQPCGNRRKTYAKELRKLGAPTSFLGAPGFGFGQQFSDTLRHEMDFIDVTLYSRLADVAQQYLEKGLPAHVEGRLQLDTWDDKQTGQKRSKLKVV
jgi:Single-strand binding protein family